jgi:dTDP-4-amino-4,6-dideoxygalactose transaminase
MTPRLPKREVPFFGLNRQFAQHREAFLGIAERVLSSGQVLQGPDIAAFERSLATACGRRQAVALGSCTDALGFALLACGVGPGDEVLVTGMSFIASVSAVLRVGATPRFVDIDPEYWQMDLQRAEKIVTPRTKAIVAVHLYGQALPIAAWEQFAERQGCALIEDAAQALGAQDGSRPAGSMGKVSCVSFDPTKVIAAFGSAGALLTDDPLVARHARMLRYHGRDPETRAYEILGFNSQLSSETAAMLDFKLSKMEEWQRQRTRIAEIYLGALAGLPGVMLPRVRPGGSHNWHKFVLRVEDRGRLAAALKAAGVQTMVHYARSLADEPLIARLQLPSQALELPEARRHAAEALSLPIFPELRLEEANYVVEVIREFYGAA